MIRLPENSPIVCADELDFQCARQAYEHISFSPESRARQEQQSFAADVQEVWESNLPHATTAEQVAWLREQTQAYKADLLTYTYAVLAAKSRTASSMITGASNFPTARNQKRLDTEHRRIEELLAWRTKARAAIRQGLAGSEDSGPISSDDPEALIKLQSKLEAQQARHALMVATNKAWRLKDASKRQAALEALGHDATTVAKYMVSATQPYPSYALTNSSGRIKATEQRIAQVQRDAAAQTEIAPVAFTATETHPAGQLLVEDNRVILTFEERTSKDFYSQLRGRGFVWAPSRQGFVRKYSADALYWARQLVGLEA